jgi:superoxide dismutase, Cu-Zn family
MKHHVKPLFAGIAIAAIAIGCAPQPQTTPTTAGQAPPTSPAAEPGPELVVPIQARSGSNLEGTSRFSQRGDEVLLVVEVRNVPPGPKAVHLHEFGDCSHPQAESAGGHWNPQDHPHGRLHHGEAHLGDIGNIDVAGDGTGRLEFATREWTIGTGADNDILGKSIVVHEGPDDFTTQPTGDAGGRIGCGVVQRG